MNDTVLSDDVDSGQTVTSGRGRDRGKKAGAGREASTKRTILHITMPEEVYWDIKMMALKKHTTVASLIMAWYAKEKRHEK